MDENKIGFITINKKDLLEICLLVVKNIVEGRNDREIKKVTNFKNIYNKQAEELNKKWYRNGFLKKIFKIKQEKQLETIEETKDFMSYLYCESCRNSLLPTHFYNWICLYGKDLLEKTGILLKCCVDEKTKDEMNIDIELYSLLDSFSKGKIELEMID